ncbi:MAG: O-antigen ligase family protein [Bacteroidia bacterium]
MSIVSLKSSNLANSKSKFDSYTSYLVLYFFIGMASMPFFIGNEFLFIFFIPSFFLFIIKKKKIDNFIIIYSVIFLIIFLAQSIYYQVIELNIILGYFFRILYAYITIKIIGDKISQYYVNIIYLFTLVSFVFYFPSLIFYDEVNNFLTNLSTLIEPYQLNNPGRTHIIIYTFGLTYNEDGGFVESLIPRNSGPFWEPGGFGVFLILAIIFELIENNRLLTKKNIIFFIGIFTTLSTGTFFVFFALITFYSFTLKGNYKILVIAIILLSGIWVYINSFFLGQKVEKDITSMSATELKFAPRTRFVSAQLDLIDFLNNPILGRGRFESTRFDVKESKGEAFLTHRNNGTTNMLVEFGIFGFFFFFYTMFKSFRAYCLSRKFNIKFAFYFVIIVLLLGFSQMIFNKPLFIGLSFMFIDLVPRKTTKTIQLNRTG